MKPTSLALVGLSLLLLAGCGGLATAPRSSDDDQGTPTPDAGITVSVFPSHANVRAGATQGFSATVTGTANKSVTWQVNGVTGGNAAIGTISTTGLFTAPIALPFPNTVAIKATSMEDADSTSTGAVTLLNMIPTLASVSPAAVTTGTFTITLNGTGFANGAQARLGASSLATTFISSTQLRASGTATSAGTFLLSVVNPEPGSSSSEVVNLQINATSSGAPTGNPPAAPTCAGMNMGQGANLNGFVPFPADSAWNRDISAAAVDPNSTALINFIGATVRIHPDFGSGLYQGNSMGIPYTVIGAQQAPVNINFTAYGDESDPGPMPIPSNAAIEGFPNPGNGDRHLLVLDNSKCWLYELYGGYPNNTGWDAGSSSVWDLTANGQRPYTWTSADAAGLPIFPGLVRYDEAAAGQINHALRFTLQSSRAAFVPPASHWAANSSNPLAAPMGMRLRLKSNFDVSRYSTANQAILNALKKYGMIMADNGSSMYLSGVPDDRWNNDDLHALNNVTASNFEVVQMNPIYTAANVPHGATPTIAGFTASSQLVAPGTTITLNWTIAGASYVIISPSVGAVRGNSVSVTATQSTTYTLYATNAFGRTTATINVTVH